MTRINTAKWIESAGRWQINVTKNGVRKTFVSGKQGRKGQLEANRKADEWLASGMKPTVSTVEELYKIWLEKVKLATSEYNYNDRVKHGKNWILPAIGHKKIQSVTEQDLQDILDDAYIKGRAEKTIKNIRGSITTFFTWARRSKYANIDTGYLTVNRNAPRGEKRILNEREIKLLFQEPIKEYWYINAFRFLFLTGLREGELLNLKIADIQNGICRILKGKTINAKREFKLTVEMQEVIEAQLEQIAKIKTEYLFPTNQGNKSPRTSLYNQWLRYQEQNGFETVISIYELRHTFISYMKDVPIEYLKMQVGHSKSMDTFGQYGHRTDTDMDEWQKILAKKLGDMTTQ